MSDDFVMVPVPKDDYDEVVRFLANLQKRRTRGAFRDENGKWPVSETFIAAQRSRRIASPVEIEQMKELHRAGLSYRTIQQEHFPHMSYSTIGKYVSGARKVGKR